NGAHPRRTEARLQEPARHGARRAVRGGGQADLRPPRSADGDEGHLHRGDRARVPGWRRGGDRARAALQLRGRSALLPVDARAGREIPRCIGRVVSQLRNQRACHSRSGSRREARGRGAGRDQEESTGMKLQVICVPGSVAPAAQRYSPLVAAVGSDADLHLKDLEVYREDRPPADYSIEQEVDAIERLADELGLTRFHLVAYSGGGFISLAYAPLHPRRVTSLAVFEPARIPGKLTDVEAAFFSGLEAKLKGLQGPDFMATFVREQVQPGVEVPPPAGPPSPEMRKRPAGIAALI